MALTAFPTIPQLPQGWATAGEQVGQVCVVTTPAMQRERGESAGAGKGGTQRSRCLAEERGLPSPDSFGALKANMSSQGPKRMGFTLCSAEGNKVGQHLRRS